MVASLVSHAATLESSVDSGLTVSETFLIELRFWFLKVLFSLGQVLHLLQASFSSSAKKNIYLTVMKGEINELIHALEVWYPMSTKY
jgi:hypothetical protein